MWHVAKLYGRLFLKSWNPDYQGRVSGWSPRRLLAMALFWPAFLLLQTINGLALLLDRVLFPRYRQIAVREPLFVVGIPRSGTTFAPSAGRR